MCELSKSKQAAGSNYYNGNEDEIGARLTRDGSLVLYIRTNAFGSRLEESSVCNFTFTKDDSTTLLLFKLLLARLAGYYRSYTPSIGSRDNHSTLGVNAGIRDNDGTSLHIDADASGVVVTIIQPGRKTVDFKFGEDDSEILHRFLTDFEKTASEASPLRLPIVPRNPHRHSRDLVAA